MKSRLFVILVISSLVCAGDTFAEGRIEPATRPLIAIEGEPGLSVGLSLQIGRRQFDSGDPSPLDIDTQEVVASVGHTLLPFLHARLLAGWSGADYREHSSKGGFVWGGMVTVDLMEKTIRQSPVVGRQEVLAVRVDVTYLSHNSDFDRAPFDWWEISAAPRVSYILNRKADPIWHPFEPRSLAVHLGLAYHEIEGDYAYTPLHEESNFGFTAAVDYLTASSWIVNVGTVMYTNNDHVLRVGVGYNF